MVYWVLVRFVGCLYCFKQYHEPNRTSNYLCRKFSVVVEVTHIHFLVYDFFRFHHSRLRDTISWECIVEDDCVRSCLIELQSFSLSKFYVDPIHRVLMFLPIFLMVSCKTRCIQVNYIRIFVFLVHRIHRREEYRLFVAARILSSRY